MAAVCGWLLIRGKMYQTRVIAWIPAAVCAVELYLADVMVTFSVWTIMLILFKIVIVSSCVGAMRYERAVMAARAKRRRELREELRRALAPENGKLQIADCEWQIAG